MTQPRDLTPLRSLGPGAEAHLAFCREQEGRVEEGRCGGRDWARGQAIKSA